MREHGGACAWPRRGTPGEPLSGVEPGGTQKSLMAKLKKTLVAAIACSAMAFAAPAFAQTGGAGGATGAGAAPGAGAPGATPGTGLGSTGMNTGGLPGSIDGTNSTLSNNSGRSGTALGGSGLGRSRVNHTSRANSRTGASLTANDILSSQMRFLCSQLEARNSRVVISGPAGTTSVAAAETANRGGAPVTGTPANSIGHSLCQRYTATAHRVSHSEIPG